MQHVCLLWQKMKAFVCLAFPCSFASVLPEGSSNAGGEPMEDGLITSLTHGVMTGHFISSCVLISIKLTSLLCLNYEKLWVWRLVGFKQITSFPIPSISVLYTLEWRGLLYKHLISFHLCFTFYTVDDYFHCMDQGRAASKALSKILKKKMKPQSTNSSMAGWLNLTLAKAQCKGLYYSVIHLVRSSDSIGWGLLLSCHFFFSHLTETCPGKLDIGIDSIVLSLHPDSVFILPYPTFIRDFISYYIASCRITCITISSKWSLIVFHSKIVETTCLYSILHDFVYLSRKILRYKLDWFRSPNIILHITKNEISNMFEIHVQHNSELQKSIFILSFLQNKISCNFVV